MTLIFTLNSQPSATIQLYNCCDGDRCSLCISATVAPSPLITVPCKRTLAFCKTFYKGNPESRPTRQSWGFKPRSYHKTGFGLGLDLILLHGLASKFQHCCARLDKTLLKWV